jgi:hypothetical protein
MLVFVLRFIVYAGYSAKEAEAFVQRYGPVLKQFEVRGDGQAS